jgi:hypothetical protein
MQTGGLGRRANARNKFPELGHIEDDSLPRVDGGSDLVPQRFNA